MKSKNIPAEVIMVAVPETAGSALYGMYDVLIAAGNIWQSLVGTEAPEQLFSVKILAPVLIPFTCGNGIPVQPDYAVADDPTPDIIILPELWLGPDEPMTGRYPELVAWIKAQHHRGAHIYSACSGSIMLAETGLLDGCSATSHWAYQELFRKYYPKVNFDAEPNLAFADSTGQVVTAGGTNSWHDLAIHIVSRHGTPGEALRLSKVYLLKWHGEGQLPYETLVRNNHHADAVVRSCEQWLQEHFRQDDALAQTTSLADIPERTLKRRFKAATGSTLIDYVQSLRVEESKRLLENSDMPVDDICYEVGYEDASFFRRVFKRRTGLPPSQYRRMFKPVMAGKIAKLSSAPS